MFIVPTFAHLEVEMESRGICAYSKVATESKTLVNESIIVFLLFNNVKICDILYLKCCIYFEYFTIVFPFTFTVWKIWEAVTHTWVILPRWCDSTAAIKAEHDMLSKSICGISVSILCTH